MILKMWFLDQHYQHHQGTYQKCKFSGPHSDLLNQKTLWWGPATCISISPPGHSDTRLNLRTTGLERSDQITGPVQVCLYEKDLNRVLKTLNRVLKIQVLGNSSYIFTHSVGLEWRLCNLNFQNRFPWLIRPDIKYRNKGAEYSLSSQSINRCHPLSNITIFLLP